MTVTWVILAVLAVGGFAAFSLLRRRRRQRTGTD
jgi:hypothetical protein